MAFFGKIIHRSKFNKNYKIGETLQVLLLSLTLLVSPICNSYNYHF